jgi:hypothetical protein
MLSGDNPWEYYLATQMLPAHRAEVLAEFRKHVPLVRPIDPAQMPDLLKRLTGDDFNTHKRAMQEIGANGEQVLEALRDYDRLKFREVERGRPQAGGGRCRVPSCRQIIDDRDTTTRQATSSLRGNWRAWYVRQVLLGLGHPI